MLFDRAQLLTDKRMRALDRRMQGVYSAAYRTAIRREAEALRRLASFDAATLRAQGLSEETIRARQMLHNKLVIRETGLVNNIAAEIARSGGQASSWIQAEINKAFNAHLGWTRASINAQAGMRINWRMYDRRQLEVLVSNGQAPFTRIAYKNLGQNWQIVQRLQNEFMQGVLLGESQQKLMNRVRKVTGQSLAQARAVAQTERTRIQSQARYMGIKEAADMGIKMAGEWSAKMINTRDTHEELDGVVMPYGTPFETAKGNALRYPGDETAPAKETVNCHCILIPKVLDVPESVRNWREAA